MPSSQPSGRSRTEDELYDVEDQPESRRRRRVNPAEADEYTEWVEERRQKGRKKRHDDDRDRRRDRDDGDDY